MTSAPTGIAADPDLLRATAVQLAGAADELATATLQLRHATPAGPCAGGLSATELADGDELITSLGLDSVRIALLADELRQTAAALQAHDTAVAGRLSVLRSALEPTSR